MAEMPDSSNFFSTLTSKLPRRRIADLFVGQGWRLREPDDKEHLWVLCPWSELIIESMNPTLVHGIIADIVANTERVIAIFEHAGATFTAESYDADGGLLRTWRSEDQVACSTDPIVHYQFAQQCQLKGDFTKAARHFERAISLDPDHLDAEVYASAAWLLANCPDKTLRNGARAVKFATVACDLTDWSEGWLIGILAVALAETGDNTEAIRTQERACELALAMDAETQQNYLTMLKSGMPIPFGSYP